MSIITKLVTVYSPVKKYLPEDVDRLLQIKLITAMQGLSHPRGYKDMVLSSYSAALKSDRVLGKPVCVTIEPTTSCNLRCTACETGLGILRRKKGSMSLENFKTIIDKLDEHTNNIMLYGMGETFLHRDVYEMISYTSQKGIFVSTCTNGEFVNAKAIIESGIGEVSFQVGGCTQKTHEVYRIRGNLKEALANLEATVAEKKRQPSSKTRILVGLIVMRHNEHEVDDFLKFAKRIGVDEALIVNPCVRTIVSGKELLPTDDKYWFYDREAFNRGVLKPKVVLHNHCEWIYYSTVIQWNGNVVPCCRDAQGNYVMGNILEQDFHEIWNGKKYREFRHLVRTDQKSLELCLLCSGYGVPVLEK